MESILNDLSLSSANNNEEHWDVFCQFYNLVTLLRNYGYDKILCEADFSDVTICGIKVADSFNRYDPSQTLINDRKKLIEGLYQNVFVHTLNFSEEDPSFVISEGKESKSLFLANSSVKPALSFVFDNDYAINPLIGIDSISKKRVTCKNLYSDKQGDILQVIVPLNLCRLKNAENEPLWNKIMTDNYLASFIAKKDSDFSNTKEKQTYIIDHCTKIAAMNGWKYNVDLSALNTRRFGALRKIFRSDGFRNQNTYLSIDMEHADLRFEMCDRKGYHLGELEVRTGKRGKPESRHNIILH